MLHEVNFEVIRSLDEFFYSEKFISLAVGPVGSTKTTAGIMKIVHHAAMMCEVLFRGLDDANDVRRLLSLQASFIIFDEFREIHPDIYNAAQGRVGRYPDKMMNGVGCKTDDGRANAHLWGMTNPPDMDTFWETLLTEPPDNVHVTIQPSGLSPEADWTQFLPDDYYDNLAQGRQKTG